MATDLAGQSAGRKNQAVRFMEYDHFIERQLGRARSQIKSVEVLTSLAILATGALVYLMLGALADHWLFAGGLSPRGRWLAFGGFAFAALVYLSVALLVPMIPELLRLPWLARLSRVTGLPVLRRIHLYYAARTIERSQGTLKNSLVNFLDLRRADLPPSVLHAVERQAAADLSRVEVEHAVDRDRLIRVLYVLLAVVAFTCLYILFSPKSAMTAFGRMLFPGAAIAPATQTRIDDVEPGNDRVFAGERVRITARVTGRVVPDELTLYYTTATRQVVDHAVPMRPEGRGSRRFAVELPHDTLEGVQESFHYFLRGGDASTPVYQIRVIVPPTATVENVDYVYPEYTGLEPKTVPLPDIAALEGTEVTVRARTNMGVSRAKLDFSGDAADDLLMDATGQELTVRFRLQLGDAGEPLYDSYRIDFQTTDGQRNPRPTVHGIKVRPDLAPEVSLVSPGRDLELPSNAVFPLVVEASDPDFALGGVKLFIREGDTEDAEMIPLGESPLGPRLRSIYKLDLQSRGAQVGDVLHYWVEARDNKQPTANHAQTSVFTVRVIDSVSEQQRQQMAEEAENVAQGETPDEDRADNEATDQNEQDAAAEEPEDQPEQATEQPDEDPDGQETEPSQQSEQGTPDEQDDVEKLKRIMEQMQKTGDVPPQEQQQEATQQQPGQPQAGEQQQDPSGRDADSSTSGSQGEQQQGPQESQGAAASGQSSAQNDAHQPAGSQQGGSGSEQQPPGKNQSSRPDAQDPSQQPSAPGDVSQAPDGDQPAGGATKGDADGTGAQQSEDAASDKPALSKDGPSTGDKSGAEPGDPNSDQQIEKSTTKPGPGEPAPNPNTETRQAREDNPAGTAQPGPADQPQTERPDDTDPSTDKGSAPTPAQSNPTTGQALKNQPSPTSDNPANPLTSQDKNSAESPPDSEADEPASSANQQRQQKASQTKGGGDDRQFSGAGREGEGQRGNAEGENQPGTNSAGQSGGAPSDQPGKEADGTRSGDDTPSNTPGNMPGGASKQPGDSQSGPGQSGSKGSTEPEETGKPQPGDGADGDQTPRDASSPRDEQPSDGAAGEQPAQQPGDANSSDRDPSDQSPSNDQSSSNQSSGAGQQQPATNQSPQAGGSQSARPQPGGPPSANATPGAAGGNPGTGQQTAAADDGEAAPGSAPNLDYTRKAANLTLDRLDEQLRRNRVDDDLLDEFGGDQQKLKDFIDRMRGQLDERTAKPEKLRDVLDRLRQPVQAATRQAREFDRDVGDVVDRGRSAPPPELRDRVNAYKKRIAERAAQAPKRNP